MASELPPEQRASYAAIIDRILASSDLDTISAKAIRKLLQAKVDYDLTEQKDAINKLITDRFDKVQREREGAIDSVTEPAPTTNGTHHDEATDAYTNGTPPAEVETPPSPPNKRKASDDDDDDDDDELSDIKDSPPPKKVKKTAKSSAESDEQMAKRLQAEFSAGPTRATRGGNSATKKKPLAKPKKTKTKTKTPNKKKSSAKVHSDDDSELEANSSVGGGEGDNNKPEKEKKGGFHKPMHLSEPLQALLGETTLSRPQTVKRIWEYVKERDLQDPSDKRQIRCDELMRAVFKSEKVHMFTMNKVLATQLWPAEEGVV